VKRINYLASWSERRFGVALAPEIVPAFRPAAGAFAASLALMALLWGVEVSRLRAAERDGAAYAQRLAAGAFDVARVRAVEHDVERWRDLRDRIAAIQRSGTVRAGEIAALGNHLPADAWLTSLHADRAALMLEGRSARLGAVGTTISVLARLPAYAAARLVAVHDDPHRAGVTYAIALETRR
jgi:Tfp pilus assembly protein PilN